MYLLFRFINACKLSVFRVSSPSDFLTTTHTNPVIDVFHVYRPNDGPRDTPTDSFIYVLALNEGTGKIEYKVGSTGRTPEIRLREWIRGHSSKGFKLVYAMKVQGRETAFAIGELCDFLEDKELTASPENEAHRQLLRYATKIERECPDCPVTHREEFAMKTGFGLKDVYKAIDTAKQLVEKGNGE